MRRPNQKDFLGFTWTLGAASLIALCLCGQIESAGSTVPATLLETIMLLQLAGLVLFLCVAFNILLHLRKISRVAERFERWDQARHNEEADRKDWEEADSERLARRQRLAEEQSPENPSG